jgi:hypothetical protein
MKNLRTAVSRFIVVLVIPLGIASAQASTLQFPEVQRLQALKMKMLTAATDVTQAMERASEMRNYDDQRCLSLVHDQAQEAGLIASAVVDFMSLSMLMKDNEDELRTLSGLRTWLTALSDQLGHSREIINGAMSVCSNSATVNVKGQNMLNILSEWSDPVAMISKKVAQAVPAKR